MNNNGIRSAQAATGISPTDFPLGSLESRAAMRALLEYMARNKPRLSEYDEDALTLYRSISLLTSRMTPNYQDVEQTEIYRHGEAIASQMDDPPPRQKAADTLSSHELTWPQLCRWRLARFMEAWERRLPALPFSIKVEGDRVYYRQWKGEWEEDTGFHADLILGRFSAETDNVE